MPDTTPTPLFRIPVVDLPADHPLVVAAVHHARVVDITQHVEVAGVHVAHTASSMARAKAELALRDAVMKASPDYLAHARFYAR